MIKINNNGKNMYTLSIGDYLISIFNDYIIKKSHSILISINLLLTIYLLVQNKKLYALNKELFCKKTFYNINESIIDKDMIGLKYPEIEFNKIKKNYINGQVISSFLELLTQLETKIIYLEKEINATKLISFYTSRTLYLDKMKVKYDDSRIIEFHDIINWLIIHKSTQLKGIASDKYLACKYVQMKLGKNLCSQRIGVYNSVEEIDFKKIIEIGNIILKVSNGNDDNIFITKNNTQEDIEKIKNDLIFHFNRDYPFRIPAFFHFYSKKRIVLEKMFIPLTDLYEFKFMVFNHDIKLITLKYFKNNDKFSVAYYDKEFNPIKNSGRPVYGLSKFKKNILNEMKTYAIKLSEDFPNFVRVDLYLFQEKIYLSELTFDSHSGIPALRNIQYFNDGLKTWKRFDY